MKSSGRPVERGVHNLDDLIREVRVYIEVDDLLLGLDNYEGLTQVM